MNHIANLLSTITNNQLRNKPQIEVKYTKLIESLCQILKDNEFLESFEVVQKDKFKFISLTLAYDEKSGVPAIRSAKLISKPGVRKYLPAAEIKPLIGGMGIRVVSTSKGLMVGEQARKLNLGGELLCEIY